MINKGLPVNVILYYDVPFTSDYQNHPFNFDNPEKSVYFITVLCKKQQLKEQYNFDYEDNMNAKIVIDLDDLESADKQWDCANYIAVYNQKTYYYFIKNIKQNNGHTVTFYLELDVLMTYALDIKTNLNDKPIETERKMCHRFSTNNNNFLCKDIVKNETISEGLKPDKIEKYLPFKPKNEHYNNVSWCYMGYTDPKSSTLENMTIINEQAVPFKTYCFPLCSGKIRFKFEKTDGSYVDVNISIISLLNHYDDTNIIATKVSPYPPLDFNLWEDCTFNDGVITVPKNKCSVNDNYIRINLNYANFILTKSGNDWNECLWQVFNTNISIFSYNEINLNITVDRKPNIDSYRSKIYEPKLQTFPCKKYVVKSQYANPFEFYPDLVIAEGGNLDVSLKSNSTVYVGSNTIFSYIDFPNNLHNPYELSDEIYYGLSGTPNYSFPIGKDAMKTFNDLQSGEYYSGKIAQGVSGLTNVAGGILVGGVKGGLNIATGINSIMSSVGSTIGKMRDLSNTPDSVSNIGNAYLSDYSFSKNNLKPYIVVYTVCESEQEMLFDYFYNYGYVVNKNCYFKKSNVNDGNDDNALFTRQIFNYIKINEDITSKLVGNNNLPFIVREKISKIFNNGITLWTFDKFSFWTYPIDDEPNITQINKYYLKDKFENAELE